MSVTAHITEQFVIKYHFGRFNVRWLLLGCEIPDGYCLDRLFMMYNIETHRDILFGWTHTLLVPVLIALPVCFIFGRWAFISFLFSIELHVVTDVFDTLGCMLFWPLDTTKYSVYFFPWYDQGTLIDWSIYFTHPWALIFEGAFLVWATYLIMQEGNGSFIRGVRTFWDLDKWRD